MRVLTRRGYKVGLATPFQQPMSAHKTLTTTPPEFVQRLITARATRSRFLRWPSRPKRPQTSVWPCQTLNGDWWSGVELCRGGELPPPHRSQHFVQLKTFGAVGGTLEKHQPWLGAYGIALTGANFC